eukprot:scaffold19336_cov199-Amphora_coffeaeformis.AAC.5
MGLAALNSPLLVSATGAGALAGLPTLERAIRDGAVSFLTIKTANALLYVLNLYAVQQPGRLDGKKQQELEKGSKGKKDLFQTYRDRTLVMPSGWAFSIWPVIFLGELVFCASAFFVKESSPVAQVIKKASAGFMSAQVFQVLWTASFRPKYDGKLMYISAAMLSGIAWSMSRAHEAFAVARSSYGWGQYLLYFAPMSLHFGWTCAALLVNLNGNIAAPENISPSVVAGAGHVSVLVAAGLGISVTLLRQAPVVGAVIAWALTACYTGLESRLEKAKDVKDKTQVGIYGARLQKWLCGTGAILSAGVSIVVALGLSKNESSS